MSGRCSPWVSWKEWRSVGDCLFSANKLDAVAAVNRVEAWRRRGRLPLGVDITASLVATCLRDPIAPRAYVGAQISPAAEESVLQCEYAMSLIRFVNGVSDSLQKGKVAASVAKHAESAGLHPLLVELRHEATHNNMPSLHALRLASSHALLWLETNYWGAQEDKLTACHMEFQPLLSQLITNQRERLSRQKTKPIENSSDSEEVDEDVNVDSECAEVSSAALKKRQQALVREIRQYFPPSHASGLAAAVVGNYKPVFKPDTLSTLPVKRPDRGCAATLTVLNHHWTSFLQHVFAYAVDEASQVKRDAIFAMASGCEGQAQGSPADLNRALVWLHSALDALSSSTDKKMYYQCLMYAFKSLFSPKVLLPSGRPKSDHPAVTKIRHQADKPDGPLEGNLLAQKPASAQICAGNLRSQEQRMSVDVELTATTAQLSALSKFYSQEVKTISSVLATRETKKAARRGKHVTSQCCLLNAAASIRQVESAICKAAQLAPDTAVCSTVACYAAKLVAVFSSCSNPTIKNGDTAATHQAAGAVAGLFKALAEQPCLWQLNSSTRVLHSNMASKSKSGVDCPGTKRAWLVKEWQPCPVGTMPTCIPGVGQIPGLEVINHTMNSVSLGQHCSDDKALSPQHTILNTCGSQAKATQSKGVQVSMHPARDGEARGMVNSCTGAVNNAAAPPQRSPQTGGSHTSAPNEQATGCTPVRAQNSTVRACSNGQTLAKSVVSRQMDDFDSLLAVERTAAHDFCDAWRSLVSSGYTELPEVNGSSMTLNQGSSVAKGSWNSQIESLVSEIGLLGPVLKRSRLQMSS